MVAGLELSTLVLWVLVGIAAAWDLAQRRIPNPLIVVGLLLGTAFQVQAQGLLGLGLSLLGTGVALLALIGPFTLRLMGGGDVKLAMVCGAFTGWSSALQIILLATVVQGVLALGFVLARHAARQLGKDVPERAMVPHAVGFALAAFVHTIGFIRIW